MAAELKTKRVGILNDTPLILAGRKYGSRLLLGTARYPTPDAMMNCLALSGCEIVFVALRHVTEGVPRDGESFQLEPLLNYTIIPNTSGCKTASDALWVAHMWRRFPFSAELIRLDIVRDQTTMEPDIAVTLEAVRLLVRDGFRVLAYTDCDLQHALALQDAGADAVCPRGSPIGAGQGILEPEAIRRIAKEIKLPVLVMGGIGEASDVAFAMELGAAGVVLNTSVARAHDPLRMARAMRSACEAGRQSFLAGRIPEADFANPSSPPGEF